MTRTRLQRRHRQGEDIDVDEGEAPVGFEGRKRDLRILASSTDASALSSSCALAYAHEFHKSQGIGE